MNKKNLEILMKASFRRFPVNLIKVCASFYSMMRSGEKSALPWKLQFENSAICNLKCRMCPQNHMRRKKGHLSFKNFKKIYDEIRPPYLNLTGFGEPLLNPDIFKIISYARKKGSFIKIDTNATILTKENIRKLLETGVDIISNSIDGMDKKTYEKIRIGANFEQVMDNLKNLVKMRDKMKSKTEIHLFLVLQKDNFKQFPDFIKFGDSIGVDSISGTFISEESYTKNQKYKIDQCSQRELDDLVSELKKLKKKTRANLEIDELIEYIETWNDKKKANWSKVVCYVPWYAPFITWDGAVTPCCYCVDKEVVWGDATRESFKSIWNGQRARNFRKMVATNRVGICAKCEADETYIQGMFKLIPFNSFVNKRK